MATVESFRRVLHVSKIPVPKNPKFYNSKKFQKIPKNSKKNSKKFQKNSKKFQKKIPEERQMKVKML